jgi:hypothetical protein
MFQDKMKKKQSVVVCPKKPYLALSRGFAFSDCYIDPNKK